MPEPTVLTDSNVPWDDPDNNTVTLEELRAGRIVPGDIGAVQRTLQFMAHELYTVIDAVDFVDPIERDAVDRLADRYKGWPLEDLAKREWLPVEPHEVAYAISLLAEGAVKTINKDDSNEDLVARANDLRDQIDDATLELGEILRELAPEQPHEKRPRAKAT